jgi:hypothetical protein
VYKYTAAIVKSLSIESLKLFLENLLEVLCQTSDIEFNWSNEYEFEQRWACFIPGAQMPFLRLSGALTTYSI